MSAYKDEIRRLWPESLVKIDRKDAPPVTGRVEKIEDGGAAIQELTAGGLVVFVAYEDMRGVASAGWDLEI